LSKSFKLFIATVILITSLISSLGFTHAAGIKSDKVFIKMIEKTDSFKKYNKSLDAKPIVKEVKDENGNPVGKVALYKFDYNIKNKLVKVDSYLYYVMDYSTGIVQELLIDNSELYGKQIVKLHDLKTKKVVSSNISQNIWAKKFIAEINTNLEKEKNKAKILINEKVKVNVNKPKPISDNSEVTPQLSKYICWVCTDYEYSPGHRDGWCDAYANVICGLVGKINIASYLLCAGLQLLACYVSSYTICVDGYWSTTCPIAP